VWVSPGHTTAYGVLNVRHPFMALASDNRILNEFLDGMRKTEGSAELLDRRADPALAGGIGGIRFVARGGRYTIRANLVSKGRYAWVWYAGTLTTSRSTKPSCGRPRRPGSRPSSSPPSGRRTARERGGDHARRTPRFAAHFSRRKQVDPVSLRRPAVSFRPGSTSVSNRVEPASPLRRFCMWRLEPMPYRPLPCRPLAVLGLAVVLSPARRRVPDRAAGADRPLDPAPGD
jgi:hypothetical protein